jgi:hypothetical protein
MGITSLFFFTLLNRAIEEQNEKYKSVGMDSS